MVTTFDAITSITQQTTRDLSTISTAASLISYPSTSHHPLANTYLHHHEEAMRWNTCDANNNNTNNDPRTGSVRSTLWKQTAAAGHRSMSYKKGRLVLPPPVTDIVETTVSISSLSSADTGKYSVSAAAAATMTAQNKNQLHQHQHHHRTTATTTTMKKNPSTSSQLLHHRKPPIPEEEVVNSHHYHHPSRVLRHRRKINSNNNNNNKPTVLFQRRDILRLVDRDKDDEHSLCSRDLDIKSAASSKVALSFAPPTATTTTEQQQQHQLFVDLESCISETSSCGNEKRQEEQQQQREVKDLGGGGGGGDPPGHKDASLPRSASQDPLLNLDRLLMVLEDDDDDDDDNDDGGADVMIPAQKAVAKQQPAHNTTAARWKRDNGKQSLLLSQQRTSSKAETSESRLKIDKMEITNQRANKLLPVVSAKSLAPTQVQRLDWTTITNGQSVVLDKDAETSSVPFDERRARNKLHEKIAFDDGMIVVDEEKEILVVDEETGGGASFPDSVLKNAEDDTTSSRQAIAELVRVTSQDVTEKAGTNRKKLMDIKNIGAHHQTTTEVDEIDKFCGMIGNMFTTLCD